MATKMTREEAIKIVQSATVWTDEERDALAMLIPELAESEDERITRAINNMLPFIPDDAYANNGVTKGQVLAWLEKQKEQKPAIKLVFPKFRVGDIIRNVHDESEIKLIRNEEETISGLG